jgi:DNA polymerase-3 subunit gamma/tau
LNCEQGPTSQPCERCPSCEEITKGHSVDVIDASYARTSSLPPFEEAIGFILLMKSICSRIRPSMRC